jgi:endonuclease/exonuclease/phosphatase family metal-dependent hydrolase
VRFLTFNLWHGLAPHGPVAFKALEPVERRHLREQLQIQTIKALSPDVAFFQEANPAARRVVEFAGALGAEAFFQPDLVGLKLFGFGIPLNLNSGLVTLAKKKWGLKWCEAISLSRPGMNLVHNWGSWQLAEERFALFTETMLPGWGKVLFVNTHMHHGLEKTEKYREEFEKLAEELELPASMVSELKSRLAAGNKRRRQEVEVLLEEIERLEKRFEAVVLCGDFNSDPESETAESFRRFGFRDAWAETNPSDAGYTFDASRNQANHLLQSGFPLTITVEDLTFSSKVKEALLASARKQEGRPRRIDFIWFKSAGVELKVKQAQLVGLPDESGFAPSDHFGVCADIEAV